MRYIYVKEKVVIFIILILLSLNLMRNVYIDIDELNFMSDDRYVLEGNFREKYDFLVAEMSYKDRQALINSGIVIDEGKIIDAVDIAYSYKDDVLTEKDVQTSTITFDTGFGDMAELDFYYIVNTDRYVYLSAQGDEEYSIVRCGAGVINLLEYNNAVYLLNGKDGTVILANNQTTDTIEEAASSVGESSLESAYISVWANNPQPNIPGLKFTYFTNRNVGEGDDSRGEIWVRDLVLGTDYSLGVIGEKCLGWDLFDYVYYETYEHDIVRIDILTGDKETVFENAEPNTVMEYPFLMSTTSEGELKFYNIDNDQSWTVTSPYLSEVSGPKNNVTQKITLFSNRSFQTGSDVSGNPISSLVICDIVSHELKYIHLPAKYTIRNYSWLNDSEIALAVLNIDTLAEYTYIVTVDNFELAEDLG